jgi:hypothetical protein
MCKNALLKCVLCCADYATLSPKKLPLTSPTSGGRSVGIVRLQSKVTELFCCALCYAYLSLSYFLFCAYVQCSQTP